MDFQKTVAMTLSVDRTGASVVCRDTRTAIVYNCEAVCHSQLDEITQKHPRVTVVIQACPTSSSGFIVIFSEDPCRHVVATADFFVVLLSSMFVSIAMSFLL